MRSETKYTLKTCVDDCVAHFFIHLFIYLKKKKPKQQSPDVDLKALRLQIDHVLKASILEGTYSL